MDVAVIDLGSNTFHLLITRWTDRTHSTILYKERIFVGLSEGGIKRVLPHQMSLGLEAIQHFNKILHQYGSPITRVMGTAILRTADNRDEFINKAEEILGQSLEIINGQREAELIYEGICLNPSAITGTHLIMDIGGGSTEFIITDEGKKVWSQSYELGVGVLYAKFQKSDPITEEDHQLLRTHIFETCSELWQILDKHPCTYLTGASGSFEVLQSIENIPTVPTDLTLIPIASFESVYNKIIYSSLAERLLIPGLPMERTKLIVVGFILMDEIIKRSMPKSLYVSQYALKEGVLSEMVKSNFP